MKKENAVTIFETLASGIRLDIYRVLVRAGLEGKVASELAQELELAPNKLSFHLKSMFYAGIVTVTQEGRFQRYRANLPVMLDVIAYLTEECCSGHPEQCEAIREHSYCSPNVLPPLITPKEET